MTSGLEKLKDMVKLAVFEAFSNYEEKLDNICKKNVTIELQRHQLECKPANRKNILNLSALATAVGVALERVISSIWK